MQKKNKKKKMSFYKKFWGEMWPGNDTASTIQWGTETVRSPCKSMVVRLNFYLLCGERAVNASLSGSLIYNSQLTSPPHALRESEQEHTPQRMAW